MKRKVPDSKPLLGFIKRNRRTLRTCVTFFLCLGGFGGMLIWVLGNDSAGMVWLQRAFADATSFVLRVLGRHTSVNGITIVSERFLLHVIPACTGTFPAVAFLSAVLAYPARWSAKLIGAALGIAAMGIINVIRLTSLFYVGVYLPSLFDQVHLLVWQSLIIVSLLLLWLFWAEKAERVHGKR